MSIELMRACAAVKPSKWEQVGIHMISMDELDEIRKSYCGDEVRMMKVLDSWTTAESPTVSQLLKLFERAGINRSHVKRKYGKQLV